MRQRLILGLLSATLLLPFVAAKPVAASICIASNGRCVHWASHAATLRSLLGVPQGALINGTSSWDQNSALAAADWNAVNADFHFTVEIGGEFHNPCGARGNGHVCTNTGPAGDNPIFFADDFCGRSFGDIIEVTNNCYNPDSAELLNAPVFVNRTVQWNAYDGPIRFSSPGVPVYDIRRVLLHEFGHVLGLDHPDEANQTVVAIMNSHVSNLDRLQDDDRQGIVAIYSQPPASSPSGNSCAIEPANAAAAAWPLAVFMTGMVIQRRRSKRSQVR
jgi:hypothetical protein